MNSHGLHMKQRKEKKGRSFKHMIPVEIWCSHADLNLLLPFSLLIIQSAMYTRGILACCITN